MGASADGAIDLDQRPADPLMLEIVESIVDITERVSPGNEVRKRKPPGQIPVGEAWDVTVGVAAATPGADDALAADELIRIDRDAGAALGMRGEDAQSTASRRLERLLDSF